MNDWEELRDLATKLPPDVYASLQSMALSGMSMDMLKCAVIDAIAKYNGGTIQMADEIVRPKKKIMDLSSYYIVPENENDPDGPCGIFDDGGYEDETESIVKRLEVFQYETIIVTEDVAAVLLDRNPNCFAGCPNLQMVDGKNNSHK